MYQTNIQRWRLQGFFTGCCSQFDKTNNDVGVYVSDNLSLQAHICARIKKANSVFYLLRRNIFYKRQAFCKLGLDKSLLLPVLTYGFFCASLSRADMISLEKFQKRVVQ